MASPGLVLLVLGLSAYALSPAESTDPGKRVESDSYTSPAEIARCITYNINKKLPELKVRNRAGDSSDESILLVLTNIAALPTTFGVIKVAQNEAGSHLTTWLPDRSLSAAPSEVAHKLIAGC
jgi:hypothetical protein